MGTEAPSSLLNESFYASTGNDTVYGGAGKDTLYGQDGWDWLYGGTGDDALYGGNDGDFLWGGTGNDLLYGEAGSDNLFGESGADTLSGGLDQDWLNGGDGNDRLAGDEGDDMLYGEDGNDILSGGAGDDLLDGGTGADTIDGGFGIDTVSYANSAAAVSVNLLTRINTGGDAQGDSLISIENLVGSDFGDILTGNSGNNTLQGGMGDDTLTGNGGADLFVIVGGPWQIGDFKERGPIGPWMDPGIDTITDFQTQQDHVMMAIPGFERNYVEVDGTNPALAQEAIDRLVSHDIDHVLVYNFKGSGNGVLVSANYFFYEQLPPPEVVPFVTVALTGINEARDFDYTDILGSWA